MQDVPFLMPPELSPGLTARRAPLRRSGQGHAPGTGTPINVVDDNQAFNKEATAGREPLAYVLKVIGTRPSSLLEVDCRVTRRSGGARWWAGGPWMFVEARESFVVQAFPSFRDDLEGASPRRAGGRSPYSAARRRP